MKKIVSLCLALLFVAVPLFADIASLSASLDADYKNGFYPGVVRSANEILRTSPNSPAAVRAAIYKGEALYRMGRLDEALATLLSVAADSAELLASQCYWLGRLYSDRADWASALSAFFKSAKAAAAVTAGQAAGAESPAATYYAYSLLYAGNAYYALSDWKKAEPLYRYVLHHGESYTLSDYEHAALSDLTCLLAIASYKDAISLSEQLSAAPFSGETHFRLLLLQGDALQGVKDYKAAYRLYCTVLAESSSAPLAAFAMQKAYAVSSSNKREVGEEPGAVLKQAEERLSAYPGLLAEFWLRLALDAYNGGDYAKAAAYLTDAENASRACAESDAASSERIRLTAALYRVELALLDAGAGGGPVQPAGERAAAALQMLNAAIGEKAPEQTNALFGAVCATRARLYGLSADWKNCSLQADLALTAHDESSRSTAVYWKAVSLYQTGRYNETCVFIDREQKELPELANDVAVQTLYARALAQNGQLHDADVLFYALGEKGALDNSGTLDYAKSLMNGGYMVSASAQAEKATGAEADYLAGLAAFNRKQWKSAASAFTRSLANGDALQSRYVPYARFYCGYAQYRAGLYAAAYKTLSDFLADSSAETHQLRFLALTTAVRASVQNGSYSQAFPLAENAIRAAQNDEQKQEAVLLCAGVYADAAQYDKAVSVLSSYTAGRTAFAFQCRYQTAQIQTQKKDFAAADKTYASLSREKAAGTLAEEAGYRRGELSYANESYADAITLFDEYCKKWGEQGQFYDASLFFAATALVKTGDTDRAILYYQRLDALRMQSPYKYSAEKNLMELYKNQREYQKAIGYAQKLLEAYGDQAREDGIAAAIDELHKLDLGYDEPTAAKEQEYEKLGKTRTEAGRAVGTELAGLWAASAIYRQRAVTLAESLLQVQVQHLPQEAAGAAKNALLVAGHLREQTENARSAELYLQAAGYARSAGDDNAASQALYGAVEAFDAAGRYGDARATAAELAKLYPKSRFVDAAKKIVEQGE